MVQYPYDTRSPGEKFADEVQSGLRNFKRWIDHCLNLWNRDEGEKSFKHYHSSPPWDELAPKRETPAEESQQTTVSCPDKLDVLCQRVLHRLSLNSFEEFDHDEKASDQIYDDDWTGYFSSASDEESLICAPTLMGRQDDADSHKTTSAESPIVLQEDFKFKELANLDLRKYENASGENEILYYSDEEKFFVPLPTFCTWTRLKPQNQVR